MKDAQPYFLFQADVSWVGCRLARDPELALSNVRIDIRERTVPDGKRKTGSALA